MRCVLIRFFLLSGLCFFATGLASVEKQQISIAVLSVDQQQMTAFTKWARYFEQYDKNLSLNITFYNDARYKSHIENWLEQGTHDLLYWQAGRRLDNLVGRHLVTPVETLIGRDILEQAYPKQVVEEVSAGGYIQALPFAQYAWGFYYNKSLFTQHGLEPPSNWEDFLTICETLKKKGINPLIQATAEEWPVLAWLDYLTLQNPELNTRQLLLSGKAVDSKAAVSTAKKLSNLILSDYFFAPQHNWPWQQTIPALLRKQAAMALMGQFAENIIDKNHSDQIGYFPFPGNATEYTEVAPLEVFLVPASSTKQHLVKRFLSYLTEVGVRANLAIELGWLPADLNFETGRTLSPRVEIAKKRLQKANRLVQYFDRDADPQFANHAASSLVNSIQNSQEFVWSQPESADQTTMQASVSDDSKWMHFSTTKGVKGTFFASKMLTNIYAKLGFNITVTRYPTLKAVIKSQQFGMDGELARIGAFEDKANTLMKIPVALVSARAFIASTGHSCDPEAIKANTNVNIGVSSESLIFQTWAKQNQLQLVKFDEEYALWNGLKRGDITHVLALESDLHLHKETIATGCYKEIADIPLFHFVNKKHSSMVEPLSRSIAEYKDSVEYKVALANFGLGVL